MMAAIGRNSLAKKLSKPDDGRYRPKLFSKKSCQNLMMAARGRNSLARKQSKPDDGRYRPNLFSKKAVET